MKKIISILIVSVFCLMPILTMSVSAAIPYDNMIALYTMEGEFKDEISGKAGTLMNGASLISDAARGSVLQLDNSDVVSPGNGQGYDKEGQHAILADSHIPDSDQMTISIWFKIKDEYRTWARVIDMGDARAETLDSPNRFINISPTNGEYTIGTINVNDGADAGFDVQNNRDRVFADLVDTDTWIHAVLVIDSTDGQPNKLYINGVAYESTHGNAGDPSEASVFSPKDILSAVDGVGKTYLGRSRYENNGDQIFNGYIDDVAIFNTALTEEQVKELMNTSSAGLLPSSMEQVEEVLATTESDQTPATTSVTATASTSTQSTTSPQTGDSSFMILLAIFLASGLVLVKKVKKVK